MDRQKMELSQDQEPGTLLLNVSEADELLSILDEALETARTMDDEGNDGNVKIEIAADGDILTISVAPSKKKKE